MENLILARSPKHKGVSICSSYTLSDAPTLITHYWWLGDADWLEAALSWWVAASPLEQTYRRPKYSDGVVSLWDGREWRHTRLPQGGETMVECTEAVPVPRPKSRLPLRWHGGRWEKNTAKGWVPA